MTAAIGWNEYVGYNIGGNKTRLKYLHDGPLAAAGWSASISMMIVEMYHDGGTSYYY